MRTWFREHPNTAVILLALWAMYCAGRSVDHWMAGEWFWAVIFTLAAVFSSYHLTNFWERT